MGGGRGSGVHTELPRWRSAPARGNGSHGAFAAHQAMWAGLVPKTAGAKHDIWLRTCPACTAPMAPVCRLTPQEAAAIRRAQLAVRVLGSTHDGITPALFVRQLARSLGASMSTLPGAHAGKPTLARWHSEWRRWGSPHILHLQAAWSAW